MNEPTNERAAAMARITAFLDAREKMRGNDPDLIGSINSKFDLTVSDLRALLASAQQSDAAAAAKPDLSENERKAIWWAILELRNMQPHTELNIRRKHDLENLLNRSGTAAVPVAEDARDAVAKPVDRNQMTRIAEKWMRKDDVSPTFFWGDFYDCVEEIVALALPASVTVASYAVGKRGNSEVIVQRTQQRDGSYLWKVTCDGDCLNSIGGWEYEPLPSSRDASFIARCRFANAQAAIDAALAADQLGDQE